MRFSERRKRVVSWVLVLCVALTMTLVPTMGTAQAATTGDEDTPEPAPVTTKYTVKATRNAKIKDRWGGYMSPIVSEKTSGTKTYTTAKTFKIKTYEGFTLYDVKVDGVSKGAVSSVRFKEGTTGKHTVSLTFRKTSLFIMLDPGHGGRENTYKNYCEAMQMWKLACALKKELGNYPNVVVKMTKYNEKISDGTIGVYNRGYKSRRCDLFISLHSNFADSSYARYPLAIVSSSKKLQNVSFGLGKELATTMKSTMGLDVGYQIWQKKQYDGRDWFGVLRGCGDVGVPGVLLENGFHSNPYTRNWLLKSTNVNRLAKNYAKKITQYYGLTKYKSHFGYPTKVNGFKAYGYNKTTAKLTWYQSVGAGGYYIYRADSKNGEYKRIATVLNTSNTSYKDTGLKKGKTYYYKMKAVRYTRSREYLCSTYTAVDGATPK